ncbi:MAG: hypothetical protein IKO84_09705 [Butyrivibrio sp.]|nr:hypothetical protein [Butyrivibrio sp.]
MANENSPAKNIKLLYSVMFFLTGLFVFAFSYFTDKSIEAIIRNTIVSLMMSGTVIFMLLDASSRGREGFFYDNFDQRNRFVVAYMIGLLLSLALSLVPDQFWPYLAVFVMLALLSNIEIGLVTGVFFVSLSVMLCESGGYSELFMYVLAGVVALAMFRDLKENSSIGLPTFVSLFMQAVLLIAFNILFLNRTLSFNIFVAPALNLMINLILLLLFLNLFGVYVIRKSNDMYMEINDPEFPLLVSLKEKDKDEYFRAIHTAYLAERIALGLGFNARAAKTCSYYHRIGAPEGKLKWDDVKHYYEENNFPIEATELLHEYIEPAKDSVKSKESLSVMLSETVIASIMYLIKKDKDMKIDYDRLIDSVLEKKMTEGSLKDFDVTFKEFDGIGKILKKEKLYYDFLR